MDWTDDQQSNSATDTPQWNILIKPASYYNDKYNNNVYRKKKRVNAQRKKWKMKGAIH